MNFENTPELFEDWWQVVYMGYNVIDPFTVDRSRKIKCLAAYGTFKDCTAFRNHYKDGCPEIYNVMRIEEYNGGEWQGMTEAKRCGNECASYRADIQLEYFKGLEHVRRTFKHIDEIQAYRMELLTRHLADGLHCFRGIVGIAADTRVIDNVFAVIEHISGAVF